MTEAVWRQQQLLESEKVSYISVSAMSKASMTRLEDIASRTHQPLVRGLLFPRAAALLSDRFSWPLSLDGQQDEVAGYSAALEVGGCCASDAVDFLGIEWSAPCHSARYCVKRGVHAHCVWWGT